MPNYLKPPQAIRVGVKGVRGLMANVFNVQPLITTAVLALGIPIAESSEVSLKPGEEVTAIVSLSGDILSDVNFTKIAAALLFQAEDTSPIQLTQKSTLIVDGGSPKTFNIDIAAPASPTNLSMRLEGGEVFRSFGRPLIANRYNLPDIAEPVNKYLDRILSESGTVGVPIELPFVIQSDSGGKVKIGIYTIEYVRLKTESWPNELDDTLRVDRNLSLDFAQAEAITLEPIKNASELTLGQIRLDVGGEFGPERLLGHTEQHDNKEFATINHEYAMAQGFLLEIPVECAGLSALFHNEAEAEVYVEILNDESGSPAMAAPLAQTTVTLPASESNNHRKWTYAGFDTPVNLEADATYWVVIKGIQGRILLALQAQKDTYLTTTLVNRGGHLWKPLHGNQSSSLPLFRLVYVPELDTQSAAVTLRLQGTDIRQPFDPLSEAQNVRLQPPSDMSLPPVLVVESQGQGTLNLANIIQEYQPKK